MRNDRFYEMTYGAPLVRAVFEPPTWRRSIHTPRARKDPILTPLFIQAGLGGTFFTIGTSTITYASIATAIATGGGYTRFSK